MLTNNLINRVAVEGYAFLPPGRHQHAHSTGELGGLVKWFVWHIGCAILVVPPTNLKKFATGRGDAKKAHVQGHIMTLWGYRVNQEDEADAFVLFHLGEAYWNVRKRRRYSEERRQALGGCELIEGKPLV